jgi:hypothetical protein
MGADKPFPPPLPNREEYVVEYSGVDDPLHAQNWPMRKKIIIGAILAFDAIAVSMGSSIFSSAIRPVAQEYGVITEVTTLGTSLYVFGYAFGPLVSTNPCHSNSESRSEDHTIASRYRQLQFGFPSIDSVQIYLGMHS